MRTTFPGHQGIEMSPLTQNSGRLLASTVRRAAIALAVTLGSVAAVAVDPAEAKAPTVLATAVSDAAAAALAARQQVESMSTTSRGLLGRAADSDPASYADLVRTYSTNRSELAKAVATEAGVSASELEAVWASTDDRRMVAVYSALSQVGTMYKRRGGAPGGFDCSGLTSWAWAQAGVTLSRSSSSQIRAADPVDSDELLPGDLVWRPGHIMMYLGVGDAVVQSPQSGRRVSVANWGRVKRFGSPLSEG